MSPLGGSEGVRMPRLPLGWGQLPWSPTRPGLCDLIHSGRGAVWLILAGEMTRFSALGPSPCLSKELIPAPTPAPRGVCCSCKR